MSDTIIIPRLRAVIEEAETDEEALYWATTTAAGAIRDKLRETLAELDAIHDALEARGVWDAPPTD